MKTIQWTEQFSVGVPSLDKQHKEIVNIINTLLETPRLVASSPEISQTLLKLNKYAIEHFELEEELLSSCGYPNVAEQIESHLGYSRKVILLHKKALHYENLVPIELLNFLSSWWTDHILHDDMAYKTFMSESL